jgi:hypothetical protein
MRSPEDGLIELVGEDMAGYSLDAVPLEDAEAWHKNAVQAILSVAEYLSVRGMTEATGSRDFGRGYARAIQVLMEELPESVKGSARVSTVSRYGEPSVSRETTGPI